MTAHTSEPAELTDTVALDLITQAVAERGRDYRDQNPRHHYTDADGRPACLVGLALNLYGVPSAALHTWDADVPEVFGHTYPATACRDELPRFATMRAWAQADPNFDGVPPATEPAIRVLWAAQIVQDTGGTWGEALDTARDLHTALHAQSGAGQTPTPEVRAGQARPTITLRVRYSYRCYEEQEITVPADSAELVDEDDLVTALCTRNGFGEDEELQIESWDRA